MDDIDIRPTVYLLCATLYDPVRSTPFNVTKSFSLKSLESMTVASLARFFVEEIIPDCVKLIFGTRKHGVIRYGDDVETEVLFDSEEKQQRNNCSGKSAIHCVSLSLPLNDLLTGGIAGFLYPLDPVLDYLSLARRSGNVIPLCIHSNGMRYSKANTSNVLCVDDSVEDLEEEIEEDDDLYDYCDNPFEMGINNAGKNRTAIIGNIDDNSAKVSQEEFDDLSKSSSFSYSGCKSPIPNANNDPQERNCEAQLIDTSAHPKTNCEIVTPTSFSKGSGDNSSENQVLNLILTPSSEVIGVKSKERSITASDRNQLTPSPMKRRKRNPIKY